ncbi:MAG: argininosuccinate lyase [Pseudomonadota bacterium]
MLTQFRDYLSILACGFSVASGAAAQDRDDFHHLIEINMASLLMLVEEDLVPDRLAERIASGTLIVEEEQRAEGARRSDNYLVFERRLIELAGPEASRLHTGRSRQDIGSTLRRMILRQAALNTYSGQLAARRSLLNLAEQNADIVIPAYTHGVQAQPVSVGHYLAAFATALQRDAERLRASFVRLNQSPLGAAALGTSGFPINRERLAALLGFDGVVINSYDANLVSSVDSKIEFASALSVSAIAVGQLMENLHTQYHGPRPWFMLAESQTDVSSIMPQKRNPRPLDRVRLLASGVVGSAHTVTLNAHNTNSGMNDYRPATQALDAAAQADDMYAAYVRVLDNLVVIDSRALDEINAEYSTMTEVADVLLRRAGVPFRVAHHYASELTTYGRTRNRRPLELTDDELEDIYAEAIGEPLPIDVRWIRSAMEPRDMVAARKGLGGPQPAEVAKMLEALNDQLRLDTEWLEETRGKLGATAESLRAEFEALAARN